MNSMSLTPPSTPPPVDNLTKMWEDIDDDWDNDELEMQVSNVQTSPVLMTKRKKMKQGDKIKKIEVDLTNWESVSCTEALKFFSKNFREADSYVKRSYKRWNFKAKEESIEYNTLCHKIIDRKFSYCQLQNEDLCNDVFKEALLQLQEIEDRIKLTSGISNNFFTSKTNLAEKNRTQLYRLLTFIQNFVFILVHEKNPTVMNNQMLLKIVQNLLMLSNWCQDFLYDGVQNLIRCGWRNTSSEQFEWLNAYCDVNASILTMLPTSALYKSIALDDLLRTVHISYSNGPIISEESSILCFVNRIICENIKMAAAKYHDLLFSSKYSDANDKRKFAQNVLLKETPFFCHCQQQLMSLCIHAVNQIEIFNQDHASTSENDDKTWNENVEKSVWNILTAHINTLIQCTQQKLKSSNESAICDPDLGEFTEMSDLITFSWWVVFHFGQCFMFNESYTIQMSSYSSLVTRLLRLSTSNPLSLDLLAAHLICYKSLLFLSKNCKTITAADLAPFISLWVYFSRKLNTCNNINKKSTSGFKKFILSNVNSLDWINKLSKLVNFDIHGIINDNNFEAFDIFLSILSSFVSQNNDAWSSLKLRFFTHIKIQILKEANEVGLKNLFSVFLTIVLGNDTSSIKQSDIQEKLLDCISNVYVGKSDYQKQNIMVSGLFSMIFIYIQKNINFVSLAQKCGKILNQMCKLFSERHENVEHRKNIWTVICSNLQNIAEVFQSSKDFSGGQQHVVPEQRFNAMLSKVKSSESVVVLESMSTIICCLKNHIEKSSKKNIKTAVSIFIKIYKEILDWLKKLCCTPSSLNEEVVSLLRSICYCLYYIHLNREQNLEDLSAVYDFYSYILYFGCNSQVNICIRSKFLIALLSDDIILKLINIKSDKAINKIEDINKEKQKNELNCAIFKSWIICSLFSKVFLCETHDELYKKIFKLNYMRNQTPLYNENITNVTQLYQVISEEYNACGFAERKIKKDKAFKWFSDVPIVIKLCIENFKNNLIAPEQMKMLYWSCGDLIKYCARILHTTRGSSKFNTSITLQVANLLLINQQSNAIKISVLPEEISCLKTCLHKFLIGLSTLDHAYDTSAQLILKETLKIYLNKYVGGSKIHVHPFFKALSHSSLSPLQVNNLLVAWNAVSKSGDDLILKVDLLFAWISSTAVQEKISKIPAVVKFIPELQEAKKMAKSSSLVEKIGFIINVTRTKL